MLIRQPDFSRPTLLFGGSFDPLHKGHLALVEGARQSLPQVEEVVFVPCYESPGKAASIAGPEERLRLLEVALKGTQAVIWNFEVLRPGPSYTIDTLREAKRLGAERENLFLLLGADSYLGLKNWKSAEEIRQFARLCVGNRPGHEGSLQDKLDISFRIAPCALASNSIRESLRFGKIPPDSLPSALEEELRRPFLNSQNPYDN